MIEQEQELAQDQELASEGVSPQTTGYEFNQRRRMLIALVLMVIALALVVIKDWSFWSDFWFPEEQTAEVEEAGPQPSQPDGSVPSQSPSAKSKSSLLGKKSKKHEAASKSPAGPTAALTPVVTNRAALPPLEIEVVAGDTHRSVRPGSNSISVDLQPKTTSTSASMAVEQTPTTPSGGNVTTEASERVRLSPETTQALARPVTPDYPLLARQMKVQGSVILQALIAKDGLIQDLQVLSGPTILAAAAREAVKQWRFKPYYQAGAPVETQARITVNFTISTN